LRAAQRADRAKSSFLAAASHDLRQPLQTLNLLQQALKRHVSDGEAHRLLAGIGRSASVMNGMLTSLLEINQLETGTLTPDKSTFPINDLFDSVAADFLVPIQEKGLEWRLVRSGATVHTDRHMVEWMIRNLLSNAMRYTDRGRILVGCRRAGDNVRVEVWDSGIGIRGEHIPRIFEEFYQVPENVQLGGFGLGLAIVQRLATVLDHRVDVRSTPGRGSGFSIELPLAQDTGSLPDRFESLPEKAAISLFGTILVIEDEYFVRSGLEQLFESAGLAAVCVATGQDALALVTQGLRPDVVVSDFNLSGQMNGVQSIEALRTALAWKIPALVLTGDIRSQVIEAIASRGVAVATKPMDGDELLQMIGRLTAGRIAET
jgi:CheY-like chemotaxis protein